ncbi:MAG TPA: YCF48-related protein [Candidatus Dormibacteraeota bacterium]|jgi:photosystem II stability/assembly factor-like uncharacterized protein|nr:YCF48-related protein [Candidatus Dormibacteraeota bacterium]
MRTLLFFLAAANALAQSGPQVQLSHTAESLRGVSAVSRQIAWASGTHGTYLRTIDGGHTWTPAQVPDAATLDFRGVVAFSADEAFLMSAGPGDQSRIYHTADAGQHWQLQFTNSNPKGFFDSMAFWDATHGIVLGDPVQDETGQLKFELLVTTDGQNWNSIPRSQLPPAEPGEAAFAASNSCLAILRATPRPPMQLGGKNEGASAPERNDPNIWFATGGRVARIFYSPDLGHTWQVYDTPITQGPDSAGIFSITFRDATHGVIVGGNYKHPDQDGDNLAFTSDGGKTWTMPQIHPQAYFSAVAYDRNYSRALSSRPEALVPARDERRSGGICCASTSPATFVSNLKENQASSRIFIVAPKFIFDFRPPHDPTRISPGKKSQMRFNAVSPYPDGGALFVGPNGSIVTIP